MTEGTIAFLGLGGMGSRMAERLRETGHPLVVWNRTVAASRPFANRGVIIAATPGEAAAGASAVIAMVRDDEASAAVWTGPDGAFAAMAPGTLAVDMSTLSPPHVRALAAQATERGIGFVEAPVAGSLPQAEAGALIVLLGGADAAVDRAARLVQPMTRAVHRVGPVGTAAAMKLAVNTLLGVQVALAGEVLAALAAAGLPPERAVELLADMPVTSPAAANALRGIASGTFAPMFPVDMMVKDLDYAATAARAGGVEPHLVEAAAALYREASGRGYGSENMTAVAKIFGTGGALGGTGVADPAAVG